MQVQPYLYFYGRCEEAVEFYRRALGAQAIELMRFKDAPDPVQPGVLPPNFQNKIMHGSFRIGDTTVLVSDAAAFVQRTTAGFDLAILDPPYRDDSWYPVLATLPAAVAVIWLMPKNSLTGPRTQTRSPSCTSSVGKLPENTNRPSEVLGSASWSAVSSSMKKPRSSPERVDCIGDADVLRDDRHASDQGSSVHCCGSRRLAPRRDRQSIVHR